VTDTERLQREVVVRTAMVIVAKENAGNAGYIEAGLDAVADYEASLLWPRRDDRQLTCRGFAVVVSGNGSAVRFVEGEPPAALVRSGRERLRDEHESAASAC
jgi:acetyl esterase/lipase